MYHDLFIKRGLSLERLQALVRVADAESLISAAGNNPVMQSQFSRQLRDLENFFECVLTERKGRTLVMSPAGKRLAGISRLYLSVLNDFRLEQKDQGAHVRIGAGERILHWIITPGFPALTGEHPSLRMSFHNMRSEEIIAKLHSHELDAGVIRKTKAPPRPLKALRLGVLRYAFFVPAKLAASMERGNIVARRNMPIADLVDPARRSLHANTLKIVLGDEVSPRFACTTLPSVARLIGSGTAAGLLPIQAEGEFAADTVRRFDVTVNAPVHEIIWLAWNPRMIELAPKMEKIIRSIGVTIASRLN